MARVLLLLAICWSLSAATVVADAPAAGTCLLTIELVDRQTGAPMPGIVQARDSQGQAVALPELINRGQGIDSQGPIHQWSVLTKSTAVSVPAAPLTFRALAGLETELAEQAIDLSGRSKAELRIPLTRFYNARDKGHLAGNTHLHLMKLSKPQADQYLRQVPLADGLDVVFLSYLERAKADAEYTSNNYTRADLAKLSDDKLRFGDGEEHRHNFGSHGEGYGHILLLDIPVIIRPVSVGPGIMQQGADAPPLQEGIEQARRAGGKVVWAHNMFGFEDIPNWITGRVHANNIFDGSERGSYKDTYYRYLNIGLKVPFSTGTDWFIYDFSRVYVTADRPVTPSEWLDLLAAGKTFITNGPLLEFTAGGAPIGGVVNLSKSGEVAVQARAIGRADFGRLELVRNGAVVKTVRSQAEAGHFVARLDGKIAIDAPSWLAVRTPPPPAKDDPELQEPVGHNEFGGALFAHTSPIYVRVAGRRIFDPATAAGLVEEMQGDLQKILGQAVFANPRQREQVVGVYEEAITILEQKLGN